MAIIAKKINNKSANQLVETIMGSIVDLCGQERPSQNNITRNFNCLSTDSHWERRWPHSATVVDPAKQKVQFYIRAMFGIILLGGVLCLPQNSLAATITFDSMAGSSWTGFALGVPDLSNTDYLEALAANPYTVGAGSSGHSFGTLLTPAGLGVLDDGVGSTANSQTLLANDFSGSFIRLGIDLGSSVFVEEFNSYGMVTGDQFRNYQHYDLYGSNALISPSLIGTPTANGWTTIANVNHTFSIVQNQTNAVHIDAIDQQFRFLLFDAQVNEVIPSTYRGSHYVEFDVVAAQVPEPATAVLLTLGLAAIAIRRRSVDV